MLEYFTLESSDLKNYTLIRENESNEQEIGSMTMTILELALKLCWNMCFFVNLVCQEMQENILLLEYSNSIATYNKAIMINKYIWIHCLHISNDILIAYFSLFLIESRFLKYMDCMQDFHLKKCSVELHLLHWIFHTGSIFLHL